MLGKNDDVLSLLYTPNRRLYGVSLEKIPFSPQRAISRRKSTAACLDFRFWQKRSISIGIFYGELFYFSYNKKQIIYVYEFQITYLTI